MFFIRTIMFQVFWTILVNTGQYYTILGNSNFITIQKERAEIANWTISNNIGQYWTIFGNIWQYWTIFGNIVQYWTIFGKLWKHLTTSIVSHLVNFLFHFFFTWASSRGAFAPKSQITKQYVSKAKNTVNSDIGFE